MPGSRRPRTGRVVVDADRHEPGVLADVVDAVGDRLAVGHAGEVVGVDRGRAALRAPLAAGVLERADQLLVFGVDADRRLAGGERRADRLVDLRKLGVAIRVLAAL